MSNHLTIVTPWKLHGLVVNVSHNTDTVLPQQLVILISSALSQISFLLQRGPDLSLPAEYREAQLEKDVADLVLTVSRPPLPNLPSSSSNPIPSQSGIRVKLATGDTSPLNQQLIDLLTGKARSDIEDRLAKGKQLAALGHSRRTSRVTSDDTNMNMDVDDFPPSPTTTIVAKELPALTTTTVDDLKHHDFLPTPQTSPIRPLKSAMLPPLSEPSGITRLDTNSELNSPFGKLRVASSSELCASTASPLKPPLNQVIIAGTTFNIPPQRFVPLAYIEVPPHPRRRYRTLEPDVDVDRMRLISQTINRRYLHRIDIQEGTLYAHKIKDWDPEPSLWAKKCSVCAKAGELCELTSRSVGGQCRICRIRNRKCEYARCYAEPVPDTNPQQYIYIRKAAHKGAATRSKTDTLKQQEQHRRAIHIDADATQAIDLSDEELAEVERELFVTDDEDTW